MKSQIMVGMIRCFIAEQEIAMFLSEEIIISLIYKLAEGSYDAGFLGVCSLSVASQFSSYVVFTLISSAPTGKVSI